jgi:hypothetical protein
VRRARGGGAEGVDGLSAEDAPLKGSAVPPYLQTPKFLPFYLRVSFWLLPYMENLRAAPPFLGPRLAAKLATWKDLESWKSWNLLGCLAQSAKLLAGLEVGLMTCYTCPSCPPFLPSLLSPLPSLLLYDRC